MPTMPNYQIYPQNYPQYPFQTQYQGYSQYTPQIQQPQQTVQPMQQMTAQIPQPQIQSNPPVNVRSEQEARDWPIAPGNSVTFINENTGYVYTKTSLNQFDRPQFIKYRLVKEETLQDAQNVDFNAVSAVEDKPIPYALKSDMDALGGVVETLANALDLLRGDMETIRGDLYGLAGKKKTTKKEDREDEN